MKYIIGTEKFIQSLDSWIFKNNQVDAEYLYRNKSKIPTMFQSYSKKLYRGMTVDDETLDRIYKNSFSFDKHTSWSKDQNIARKFVDDPKYAIGSSKGKQKLIVEKVFTSSQQILDIDTFILFMGHAQLEMMGFDEMSLDSAMKEKEVLISKGAKLLRTDFKLI